MDVVDVAPFCIELEVLRDSLLKFVASLNAQEDCIDRACDVAESFSLRQGSQLDYLVKQVELAKQYAARTARDFLAFLADMGEEFASIRKKAERPRGDAQGSL
jgi:hypothetical protein